MATASRKAARSKSPSSETLNVPPQVLEVLEQMRATKGSDDGLTTIEWADKLDIGKGRARRMIRAAIESGKMVHGKRRVTYINGNPGNVDVYRVV